MLRACLSPLAIVALALLASRPAAAENAVRGYPAGTTLAQTPYYSAYYPVQYGYAFPPQSSAAAAYQAAYPTIRLSPQTTYYAPAYAAARPAANYTLSPAGGMTAGSEAYAYYGQSTPLNYVAPTYRGYQTQTVQVPVTYYRPYTVYQPGVAAPLTCQRAACGTACQPTTHRWFSCLDWLFHHKKKSCGAPPAAVPVVSVPVAAVSAAQAVCYGSACKPPCGTPYYNTVPPAVVVPGTTIVPGTTVAPSTVAPSTVSPPRIISPPIVPPPGTRIISPPGTGGIRSGADIPPSLPPGTTIPPSGVFPGTGSGASFRPETRRTTESSRESEPSPYRGPSLSQPTVSEPTLGPRRSVQPVPDPAAGRPREQSAPANRAPQLLTPGDRTASVMPSLRPDLQVVPAQWPEKSDVGTDEPRGRMQPVSRHVSAPAKKVYDDTLWKSAAE